MRGQASLSCFRIVKLPIELQQEYGLPELICADPQGMPFWEGQAFYAWLTDDNACEKTTAHNYLKAILPFLTFLQADTRPLLYTAPAEEIRNGVRDYLKEKLECAVRPHKGGNYVVMAPKIVTIESVRLFLVALRRFYEFTILKGLYRDSHPLIWAQGLALKEREFTPRMPPQSGMTLPGKKEGRMPETYFCVVGGDWVPRIIDDPDLPKRLIAAFAYPRDRLIARMLFESGARVSEVLGLRLADWRGHDKRERARTTKKGSRGRRVKEIWWSSATTQLLRNYINHDRRLCDPQRLGLNDLPDSASLFITDEGNVYSYADFYFHWRKACVKAGIRVTPHQARHWFVTMALRKFQTLVPEKQAGARESLIAYMSWKNPETIRAYDHHIRRTDFGPIHLALSHLVDAGSSSSAMTSAAEVPPRIDVTGVSQELLDRLGQLLDTE